MQEERTVTCNNKQKQLQEERTVTYNNKQEQLQDRKRKNNGKQKLQ